MVYNCTQNSAHLLFEIYQVAIMSPEDIAMLKYDSLSSSLSLL